ncbi:MAG TPA: hypothetical protein VGD00_00105 [Solirubrobacteraceae bacterium]
MRITQHRRVRRPRTRALSLLAIPFALAATAAGATGAGAAALPPHVSTAGVSHVHGTAGQLDGVVNPNGEETSYFFRYGPSVAYGQQTKPVLVGHGATPIKVGQTVTALIPGYHYQIVATAPNPEIPAKPFEVRGKDKTFSGGKASKLKFQITKGKEAELLVRYGGTALLTGSLRGSGFAGKGLTLQGTPFPFTGAFVPFAGPVLSSRSGTFLFSVSHIKQSTEFRVLTVDARPVYSPTMIVHVEPAVTLRVQKLSGGRFRFYGTIAPTAVHGSILIQQLRPQKANSKKEGPKPHTVAFAPIKRAGKTFSRFTVTVAGLTGNFRYRAYIRLPKGPLQSGHSSNVLVKAPKAAAKTRKHSKTHKARTKKRKK